MKICIWEPFLLLICVGGNFFCKLGWMFLMKKMKSNSKTRSGAKACGQKNENRHNINTVCQQKGPLAGYENRKFPKPFQGGLGMLVGPPSSQKLQLQLHRPACTANFKCYFSNFGLQKNPIKCSVLTTFLHLGGQLGQLGSHKSKIGLRTATQLE